MKQFTLDDQTYAKDDLISLRGEVIELRNHMLVNGAFEQSVILTHTIAFLYHAIQEYPEE